VSSNLRNNCSRNTRSPRVTPVLSLLTAYLLTAHPLAIRLPATRRSLHALQSIPAIILLVSNPLATPVLSPLTAYLLTAHPLAIRLPATRRSLHALQSIPAITLLSDLESMTPAEIIFAQCQQSILHLIFLALCLLMLSSIDFSPRTPYPYLKAHQTSRRECSQVCYHPPVSYTRIDEDKRY
jgi:hypothetical protein